MFYSWNLILATSLALLALSSLSPGTPRGVPGEGLSVKSVFWYSERGARGRLVCLVCLLVLREGCQGKACLSVLDYTPSLTLSSPTFPSIHAYFRYFRIKCLINSHELAVCLCIPVTH